MVINSATKMVTLTIDNQSCTVPEGTTILKAAESLGINIPTLCYLKELAPDASCRMCIVEIKGGRKGGLVPSCSEHCAEDMVVYTRSERVVEARRFILDLLLSNHNLDCFTCARNGSCKLQEYCLEYGVERTSFAIGKHISAEADTTNRFYEFRPDKCIMCHRCTRVCEKLQGRDVLSIAGRGFDAHISTCYDIARTDPTCESCGNCVSACPTGALSSYDQKKNYRSFEVTSTRTTCPHCAVGCQYDLLVKNGKIVGVDPAKGPSNQGMLCVKGRYGSYKFVHAGDRLTSPLIKKDGNFEPASWEEALSLIADKFKQIKKEEGPDAIAGFSCSRSSNEDNYMFQKMMRAAVGTNNVDNCARVCHSPSVAGLATTLGSGAMTNPFDDITAPDVDVMLIVGTNPEEAYPVFGSKIRRAVREGCKLIVVDPRSIGLAKSAAVHLQIKPGTNVAFANGMMHIILEDGLADMEYIKERTEGFEELKEILKDYTPEKVAKICGIDADDLRKAAHLYAKAKKAPIMYSLGVTEHSTGTEGVMSLSNLAMMVGKIGRSGCGINPIRGQNNVQGACDMGCLPGDFPGYQKVKNPDVRKKFSEHWGTTLSSADGFTATRIPEAVAEGKVKALYIFGEDPVRTDPDITHIKKMLKSLDFLVVQELFMTKTAEYADVVLPGMSYAEKEGTFTNSERRVQRIRKAVELEGDMRPDAEIFYDVMNRLGYPQPTLSASEIMQEIAELTPSYHGISHARLDAGETLQWPCKDEKDKGAAILHVDKFTRGLGYFYPAKYQPSAELPDEEYPFTMITGRMLYHYNAGAMTQRTEGLNELCPSSYMEMHKVDADSLGIKNGDRVKVASRRGEIETTAIVADKVKSGEVFMPFHFEDGNVNYLTNAAIDSFANVPEYKACAVRIKRA
ncbi:formate dehydrogenase subunit alpha [Blautia liquoris]|uniref:Formate dehydrogenase subunit alpha n=2 Tax=Blautia liquoris TaxID=2779518 RepID=A0A7M2RIN0_9FIRM|nr:formate dehydrogenase subunit alpha [Blautia liquoris]